MNTSTGSDQTITALVIRALWKQSARVFVESYRLLHDWPPKMSLFEGEALLRVYPVVEEPRSGPIGVTRNTLSLDSIDDARGWFAGNTSPYVQAYHPETGPPPSPLGPAAPDTRVARERRIALADAMESQRISGFAPANIAPDDVLWDEPPTHDWIGVRSLQIADAGYIEAIDVVALEFTSPQRQDRAYEVLAALALDESKIVALEYQYVSIRLNNSVVFQVRRQARLSDADYVRKYVDNDW